MERFAEQLEDDLNELISCISQVKQERIDRAIRRLVAYEDTGLTPEEVKAIKDAEEKGLLVRLPCKSEGANLFFVDLNDREIYKEAYTNGIALHWTNDSDLGATIPLSVIGKTVFLTREEAEAALEEGEPKWMST